MPAKTSARKANLAKKSKSTKKQAGALSKKTKKPAGASASKAKLAQRKKAATFVAVAADPALANFNKIEHIVVLMLENRSFDHILGYLTLEDGRADVDGLTQDMRN